MRLYEQPTLPALVAMDPWGAAKLAKAQARQYAESLPERRRPAIARATIAAAMSTCWRARVGHTNRRLRDPWCEVEAATEEAAEVANELGLAAARLSPEHAAYALGSAYAAMLPEELRRERGVFYTPPDVAARLLEDVSKVGINWRTCTVLDPACGGGAFLSPLVSRMLAALSDLDPQAAVRHIGTHLRGYEIDPFSAWLSQSFVDMTLLVQLGGEGYERIDIVDVIDSLTRIDAPPAFDLCIGNPPYGRVALGDAQRASFRRSLFGHANIYGVFLDLAMRWTRVGGFIAFVTPASFLSGEYFKKLRALLATEGTPYSIDFVAERRGVFDDVLQETVLFVGRVGHQPPRPVSVAFVTRSGTGLRASAAETIALPTDPSRPWLMPRRSELVSVAARVSTCTTRLAAWGYGVSTGPLVWNRHKSQRRLHSTEGATVPIVWAESVTADGRFEFRADRRNHAPHFAVKTGDDWLLVRRPCVLVQRTTAVEQPRRLVAAELSRAFLDAQGGAVTVENHLNMVVPIVEAPAVPPAAVAAFLNSAIADRVFRCISGSVAVSAFELEAMPLPTTAAMGRLAAALRNGTRASIEAVCESLYDR